MLICFCTKVYITILLFTGVKVASVFTELQSHKPRLFWCPLHFPELAEVSPRTHTREPARRLVRSFQNILFGAIRKPFQKSEFQIFVEL